MSFLAAATHWVVDAPYEIDACAHEAESPL